jgi:hypothetical protein
LKEVYASALGSALGLGRAGQRQPDEDAEDEPIERLHVRGVQQFLDNFRHARLERAL